MEEHDPGPGGPDLPGSPTGSGRDDAAQPGAPRQLTGPDAELLEAEEREIRKMIEAGASTPEELRALAERMRAHRAREEALWKAQVKPTLKPKRGGLAPGVPSITPDPSPGAAGPARQTALMGVGLLLLVLVVVIVAASSSAALILLPVAGVLGYAWYQGSRREPE